MGNREGRIPITAYCLPITDYCLLIDDYSYWNLLPTATLIASKEKSVSSVRRIW